MGRPLLAPHQGEPPRGGEGGVSPQPRASLRYNEALVEQKRGNDAAARTFYEQSLALRPNAEVAAARKSLDKR